MNHKNYDADVIIIGGGPIGLASAYECAKQGKSVILLERFSIGNQNGSSAGHVRMWRIMYTEIEHARLAIKAGELYKELEADIGEKILYKNGLLNFGVETDYTPEGTLETAIDVMDQLGKKYTRLNKNQIERRYPFQNLPDNFHGVWQEDGATIDVKKVIEGLHNLNITYGVDIMCDQHVKKIKSEANGVEVITNDNTYTAKKVIVASGAYINEIVKTSFNFEFNILIWEMCFAYYKITDPTVKFPMFFQFDDPHNGYSNLFYGFPEVDFGRKGFVRLAVDWASCTFTDINEREFTPRRLDIALTRDYAIKYMRGVDSCPIDMASALMAHFPDNHSLLDFAPKKYVENNQNVILCAGGWAFKFAPLFGKVCAELAIHGKTSFNIDEFTINRKGLINEK